MKYFGEKLENINYKKRPGAYAILKRKEDHKIGIVTDGKDNFYLGGGIEEGETVLAALKREALEEAGYQLKNLIPFETVGSYLYSKTHGYLEVIANVYIAELDRKMSEPKEQDHVLLWIEPTTYVGKMCQEWQEYILKKYMEKIEQEE